MFLAAFRLHILIIIYIIMLLFITWPYNFRTSRRRRMDLGVLIDVRWGINSHLPTPVECGAAYHGTRRTDSSTGWILFCSSQEHLICNWKSLKTSRIFSDYLSREGGSLLRKNWNIPWTLRRSGFIWCVVLLLGRAK